MKNRDGKDLTSSNTPYLDGKVGYTQKGKSIYGIYMPAKDEKELPTTITIKTDKKGDLKASLLGTQQKLTSKKVEGGIIVTIPQELRTSLARQEAVVIKLI